MRKINWLTVGVLVVVVSFFMALAAAMKQDYEQAVAKRTHFQTVCEAKGYIAVYNGKNWVCL